MRAFIIAVAAVLIAASFAFALDFKAFRIDGLATGLSSTKAVEKYGQPAKKSKAEFWAATGEWHVEYEWPTRGITVDMVGESEKASSWSIGHIAVRAPFRGKTDKGIGIGSNAAEVSKAYGKPARQESDTIYYTEGECCTQVIFTLKNNAVKEIWIGPTPE